VSAAENKSSEARTRSLLWMEALWEGANTTAWEEQRKEEVLAVFRELATNSSSSSTRGQREEVVREYVPWKPLW